MGYYNRGTDNTMSQQSHSIGGGNVECWIDVDKIIHIGRKIDLAKQGFKAGDVIPAGSMVHFDNESDYCEVIKADAGAAKLKTVNGMTLHDVKIVEGTFYASTAIVTSGKCWGDATDVPASVEAQLSNIEFVRLRKDAREAYGIE